MGLGQYEAAFRDNSVDADKADVVDLSSEIEVSAPLVHPTPSAEDRFLALSGRSLSRCWRAAQGRFDAFARLSVNGRMGPPWLETIRINA
jgi:hypothetical protein